MGEAVMWQEVYADALDDWWPLVEPLFEVALEYRDHRYTTLESFKKIVADREGFLLVHLTPTKVLSGTIIQIREHGEGVTGVSLRAYGQHPDHKRDFLKVLEWAEGKARVEGHKIVEALLRADAVKLVERVGYRPGHRYVSREV